MEENVSVVYNPLNTAVKKNYGLGVSNPYANAGYDFSTVTKQPEVKQEEGLFSRLGSMFGGGSNTDSNNDGTGVLGTIGEWFQPQGQSGASTAGNVLSGLGTAVGIGSVISKSLSMSFSGISTLLTAVGRVSTTVFATVKRGGAATIGSSDAEHSRLAYIVKVKAQVIAGLLPVEVRGVGRNLTPTG